MASGSQSEPAPAAVAKKWEVCPTEDVVQALMEKLVDPRLPWRISVTGPPTNEAQAAVAKQIHAVVLLYNYYHRKQKAELRFLDFVSFCKMAIVIRPRLISFMKLMKESKSMELNSVEDKLSVTEKAIKEACDISVALDISKDVPNTELWPVLKVAVLVVDPKQENCYLEFGLITEGVWSLIEKSVDKSRISADISIEDVIGNKRKRNDQSVSTVDSEFLQLGYDAVEDATGFGSSNLVVLETHVVYSLCHVKAAAHFFIIQCSQSFSIKNQVPLKFLVESLQGPLAEKSHGSWTATPVVEFYHLLPYVEHISCWLSRKDLSLPSFNSCSPKIATNSSEMEIKKNKISVLPLTNFNDAELDNRDSYNSRPNTNSSEKIGFNIKKFKQASCGNNKSPDNSFQKKAHDGNGAEKLDKIHKQASCSNNKGPDYVFQKKADNGNGAENLDKIHKQASRGDNKSPENVFQKKADDSNGAEKLDMMQKQASCGDNQSSANVFQKIANAGNDTGKLDMIHKQASCGDNKSTDKVFQKKANDGTGTEMDTIHDSLDSANKPGKGVNLGVSYIEKDDLYEGVLSDSSIEIQRSRLNNLTTSFQESDCNKNLDSNVKVYYHRRKNVPFTCSGSHDSGGDFNLNDVTANESCHVETMEMDGNVTGASGAVTILCNQSGTNATQKQEFHQSDSNFSAEVKKCQDPEDVQNALSLLYRKRQELCAQMVGMEDTLAFYEDNIQRIREGGDIGLARQCIKSILTGNQPSPLYPNKGHHETYLPGQSSCQDLEYICLKNNWSLPRYIVEPAEGKFLSMVVVKSKYFKISSKGGLEYNPSGARESAAAQAIARIKDLAAD